MFYRDCTLSFGDHSKWKLFKRIGDEESIEMNDGAAVAAALYHCARIENSNIVQRGIMKIYTQYVHPQSMRQRLTIKQNKGNATGDATCSGEERDRSSETPTNS